MHILESNKAEHSATRSDNTDEITNLLITIAKDEYSLEIDRIGRLDNKARILSATVILAIIVGVSNIPFEKILSLIKSGVNEYSQFGLFLMLLLVSAFGFLAVAAVFIYRSIQIKEYYRFGIANVAYSEILKIPVSENKSLIFHCYQKSILNNREENEKKSKELKMGIKFCVYGFALLVMCFLITNIASATIT